MGQVEKQRISLIAFVGLWELCVAHQVLAGQPLEKISVGSNHIAVADPPATAGPASRAHLDLSPPFETFAVSGNAQPSNSGYRRHFGIESPSPGQTSVPFEAWSAENGHIAASDSHRMSPMETIAHNFRQQGLPVARLFENRDSLVHLGFNQKGKPGLWILHKLH